MLQSNLLTTNIFRLSSQALWNQFPASHMLEFPLKRRSTSIRFRIHWTLLWTSLKQTRMLNLRYIYSNCLRVLHIYHCYTCIGNTVHKPSRFLLTFYAFPTLSFPMSMSSTLLMPRCKGNNGSLNCTPYTKLRAFSLVHHTISAPLMLRRKLVIRIRSSHTWGQTSPTYLALT